MKSALRWAATLMAAGTLHAAIVSQSWRESKLTLELSDGQAQIEWISGAAFRVERSWGASASPAETIKHDPVLVALEDAAGNPRMRSRYLNVVVDRNTLELKIDNSGKPVADLAWISGGLKIGSLEKVFGFRDANSPVLNLKGQKFESRHGFFFTGDGYGMFLRSPEAYRIDLAQGVLEAGPSMEFIFYFGPTPKEILEQHQIVTGQTELGQAALGLLGKDEVPKQAVRLPEAKIEGWDGLAGLARTLNRWSLSGVLYPALDLASLDEAPEDVKQRALDLAAMLPVVYRSSGTLSFDSRVRDSVRPYLITYLREASDRGFPLIRPLSMQFWRDADSDEQTDVFMLGDEFLLAPMIGPGTRRKIKLPRGLWTDLRTNIEYQGRQTVEVDAPVGRTPMFTRNGALFPIAAAGRMELHYYPSLGGEFFLWEPNADDNSQFHAAPAGDFLRVEVETKIRRTYEWVLHHTASPKEVAEDTGAYKRVDKRSDLIPGTWWHDAAENNLHLMLRAESGTDRIVNISF